MSQIALTSKPASIAEISSALQVLFNALPFQRGSKSDDVAGAYVSALTGSTAGAIAAGIQRFLRGECEDVSQRFVPTPPELARIVRTAVQPVHRKPPVERPMEPLAPDAKSRMRLKMPMWSAAFGSIERLDALAKANAEGLEAMIVLAMAWGVPVPPELLDDPHGEERWHQARSKALAEMERNPPPYLRRQRN